MKDFKTNTLLIMNCSLDMAKSIIFFRDELTGRSPLNIPVNWPSHRFLSFLPFLIEDMEKKNERDYYMWIIAELTGKSMIGDMLLFPDSQRASMACLEIRFYEEELEKKFLKESLKLFLDHILTQFAGTIKQVLVEADYRQILKIEILKELGFHLRKKEHPYLIWSYAVPEA